MEISIKLNNNTQLLAMKPMDLPKLKTFIKDDLSERATKVPNDTYFSPIVSF